LLLVQGSKSRKFTKAWASALNIKQDVYENVLSNLQFEDKSKFMSKLSSIWKPHYNILDLLEEFSHTFQDEKLPSLINVLKKDWPNDYVKEKVLSELDKATERIINKLESTIPSIKELKPQETAAIKFVKIVESLVEQVEQRLIFINKRLALQDEMFKEDLNSFIDSSVDLVELGMRDLVDEKEYSWANKLMWEKFSESDAANSIRSKFQPLDYRYKSIFELWN